MTVARPLLWALAAAAGAVSVAGFAPFGLPALPVVTLALLFFLWSGAATPREAAAQGYAFGAGLFGAGISWVYVALTAFGDMPPVLGALSTAAFCAYLSLWPAAAGYVAVRFTRPGSAWRLVACAGAWTATEWLRGYGYTGFPWLALGYAQVPGSPLVGYAPVGGVFLVSLAAALIAACIAWAIEGIAQGRVRAVLAAVALVVGIAGGGFALARIAWTEPSGAPLPVSLVQGNVLQEDKFKPAMRARTFGLYRDLVARSRGRLVVLPESAFPMFAASVPDDVIDELMQAGAGRRGLVLLGLFTAEAPLPGSTAPRYFNTVAALGEGDVALYRKRHLVPFGESIPLKALIGPLINDILDIPLSDQTPGDADQPAFVVDGQRVAVNICYEDAFGGELIPAARQAGILVNVTNDAWYGHSLAALQHNQMSAMRAVELGRPMLRATNTGMTSSIGVDGREAARLPWFTRGILEVEVQGRSGATPFLRFGEAPALAVSLALVAAAGVASRPARRS